MSEALTKLIQEIDDKNILDEHKIINAKIDPRFYDYQLLKHIHAELDVKHKLDHKEKVATFIVVTSAYLQDPRDHCSCALKGNSSSGKDSNTDNVLSHFPKEDWIKVTRVTTATLEDDVQDKRIVAFSEINKNRENGANAEIVETFKQMAEGGTSTLKKDIKTGFKTAIRTEQEQKTLIYGTTETESDDELETRYVIVPIRGYREKNKIVVDDVLNKASDEEYYLRKHHLIDSWIATSIFLLDKNVQVIIPFSKILSEKINDKEIFDTTKDRVKRDVKRILSLTRAITWLHQKQRVTKFRDDVTFIYAEPTDFLNALNLFGDFFNLTYSGLDHRLVKLLEYVEKNIGKHSEEIKAIGFQDRYGDWLLRHKVQKALNIASVKTIRDWCQKLTDRNKIDAISCNAIKTGQHTPYVKHCDSCLLKDFCQEYIVGSDCVHISPKTLKIIMQLKGFKTTEEYDNYFFDLMQDVSKGMQNFKDTHESFGRMIELLELKNEVMKRGGHKELQKQNP